MKVASLCWLVILLTFPALAQAQQVPMQAPVPRGVNDLPPMVPLASVDSSRPSTPRLDPVALQREARELLDAAQSLQFDMDSLKQGLLPKDTLDKLKRIEKLSKHLRGTIAPLAH